MKNSRWMYHIILSQLGSWVWLGSIALHPPPDPLMCESIAIFFPHCSPLHQECPADPGHSGLRVKKQRTRHFIHVCHKGMKLHSLYQERQKLDPSVLDPLSHSTTQGNCIHELTHLVYPLSVVTQLVGAGSQNGKWKPVHSPS